MDEQWNCTGFDWDDGNSEKNWLRHQVSRSECEEVFFNLPLVVHEDREHSEEEDRFLALGQTDTGRLLFVVYTFRGERIRVISARDMTPRERRWYEHDSESQAEADPQV